MKVEDIYIRNAKVINIVDGDTFDGEVDLGFHLKVRERFRILGIDAPEKFGPTKYEGLKSKQYLVDNLINKNVVIISTKMDGFRRYLADVYITNSDGSQSKLADIMVKSGLANLMYR
jgi:endonuclease YncB( thermonuclease family)